MATGSIFPNRRSPGHAKRVGQISLLTPRTQAVLQSSVNRLEQFIGRHVFHLLHQFAELSIKIGRGDLPGGHLRKLRIGKDIDPNDVSHARRNCAPANCTLRGSMHFE